MAEHAPPRARVVLLPGAYDSCASFRAAGFEAAVSERGLRLELRCVDYDAAQLADRAAAARLRERIVEAAGTAPLWLVGVSLGGYVALQCADADPQAIDGVCLLAPYLGGRALIAEIARAPGLAAWVPGEATADDDDRRLWRFLRERSRGRGAAGARLYLGSGRDDRFAAAHTLLADALPASAVDRIPGGHDWPTWRRLWDRFLDAGALP